MNNSKKERTADHVLKDLHQFLSADPTEIDTLTDEQVNKELSKRNIDSTHSFAAISEMLGDALIAARLAEAKEQRIKLLTEEPRLPRKILSNTRDQIIQFLNKQPQELVAGYFSKLKSCEDEDLESFMEDLRDLGIIDEDYLEEDG